MIKGIEELRTLVGQQIGTSDWVEITQEQIQTFADATGDHQWIHCDRDRARRESPYQDTIAHGFLTLSLGPGLAQQISMVEGVKLGVNYGLNRVRFPNAVKVGSRVRMISELIHMKEKEETATLTYKQTFEIEGQEKPACVAEMIARLYF